MSQRPRVLSIVLAVLLIGVLVRHWTLVRGVYWNLTGDPLNPLWSPAVLTYLLVVGGFLVLLIASAVGLLRLRPWGIYCAYALVPVSTILHGISLIPFLSDLLPTRELGIAAVLILNLTFLTAVMILHTAYRRANRQGQQDAAT